jgi:hypothetical protein
MSRKNRRKKRRRDRRREEFGIDNTTEKNNQNSEPEKKIEETKVVTEKNKDTNEDQFEEPPEVLESEDENTNEDPFETDTIDMEPSRKGRVISTLIVIVVAIVVIWVFAKNSDESISEEAPTEAENTIAETEETVASNPQQEEFAAATTAAQDYATSEGENSENELAEKSSQLKEKMADYDEEIRTQAEADVDKETEEARRDIADTKDVTMAALETLRKNVMDSEAIDEELDSLITDATAEIENIKDELARTTGDIITQTTESFAAISKQASDRNEEKVSVAEAVTEEISPALETEDVATETEVVEVDFSEEELAVAATTTADYTEVAAAGDSVTSLARLAIQKAIDSGDLNGDFSSEHRVYMEDYLRRQIDEHRLNIGDSITFPKDLINSAATKALSLTDKELANLTQYSSRISW